MRQRILKRSSAPADLPVARGQRRSHPQLAPVSKMQAAVLYGKEDVRVEEVSAPPLAPGEVRMAIRAALTCGTDLKVYKRGYHARMIVPPALFGHEMAGELVEVRPAGLEKIHWRVGDRVVVANSYPCGGCPSCKNGHENLCDHLQFLNGAYAQTIVIPAQLVQKNLLKLQLRTTFEDAALTEPLACVVQGLEDANVRRGQSVLVIGAGPIGLMFVALARQMGCAVTVAGRGQNRLAAALRLGAAHTIEVPTSGNLPASLLGKGPFDVVIEAVGKAETWEAAIGAVVKGGTVNLFGGCPAGTKISLDAGLMHYSSLRLISSFHHTPRTFQRALRWIEEGVVRAADFVDGQCTLDQLPALFRSMATGNRAVKTLVRSSL